MAKQAYTFRIAQDGKASEITGFDGPSQACANLPSVIEGKPVTRIAEDAFANDPILVSVVIPEGVEWIGDNAFSSCHSLISVKLPASLWRVWYGAFSDCPRLRSVFFNGTRLPSGLKLGPSVKLRAPRLNEEEDRFCGLYDCKESLVKSASDGSPLSVGARKFILENPLLVLDQVVDDVEAVRLLANVVEDIPDIGDRFNTLTAMATLCSENELPEQATIILDVAKGQSGMKDSIVQDTSAYLML